MESEHSTVLQERFSQVGTTPNSAGSLACLTTDRPEILANELGHVRPRQVAPEVFRRVEFRCIRRQIFECEPRLLRNPGLDLIATMGGQPVPQQDDLSPTHVSLQRLEVSQDLRLLNRAGLQPQAQPDATSRRCGDQAGDGR